MADRFSRLNKQRIFALILPLALVFLILSMGSFHHPACGNAETVKLILNQKQDTSFSTLEEFEMNDSLVFSDVEISKKYKLVNYELRLLARPKPLYHTVIRSHELPKNEIRRYYNNAESTITVFLSDIRLESLKDHHILQAKALKFKILKAKSN